MHYQQIVATLDPTQQAIVALPPGPIIVSACPGSGKTRVLLARIAHHLLVDQMPPAAITAVTFTTSAAHDVRHRLRGLLGPQHAAQVQVRTLHSFGLLVVRSAYRALGYTRRPGLLTGAAQRQVLVRTGADPHTVPIISRIKRQGGVLPADQAWEAVYERYQHWLHQHNQIDFDDVITLAARALQVVPAHPAAAAMSALLIDEAQDLSSSDLDLLAQICTHTTTVFACGDQHQAIYTFRGSAPDSLDALAALFAQPTRVALQTNYRSTPQIVALASAVLGSAVPHAVHAAGPLPHVIAARDPADEAEQVAAVVAAWTTSTGVPPNEIALLYRTHRQRFALEFALWMQQIPYQISGALPAARFPVVALVRAGLQLSRDPTCAAAWHTLIAHSPVCAAHRRALAPWLAHHASDVWAAVQQPHPPSAVGRTLDTLAQVVHHWHHRQQFDPPEVVVDAIIADTGIVPCGEAAAAVHALRSSLAGYATVADLPFLHTAAPIAPQGVQCLTMHQAKGREFRGVVVVGLEDGTLPYRPGDPDADIAGEQRLLYVALTRAQQHLVLSYNTAHWAHDQWVSTAPSRFLASIVPPSITNAAA